MDFSLSSDLEQILILSVGLGALGGFTSDVIYPIQRSSEDPKTGLENRITWPRLYRARRSGKNKTVAADLGFLGPIVVGVVAGLIAVFAIGVTGPAADETAKATAQISQEFGEDSTASAADPEVVSEEVEEGLSSRIPISSLIPLALIGGFAGYLILQTATARVSTLLGAAAIAGAQPAVQAAKESVEQAARDAGLPPAQVAQLAEAAEQGAGEGAEQAVESLGWKPPESEDAD